jgi:hypothetical protein
MPTTCKRCGIILTSDEARQPVCPSCRKHHKQQYLGSLWFSLGKAVVFPACLAVILFFVAGMWWQGIVATVLALMALDITVRAYRNNE